MDKIFKHYKGGLYKYITLAKLESSGETMVLYECCDTYEKYVRPYLEFREKFTGVKDKDNG